MQVQVLFFGILKDLAGQRQDSLRLPEHATLEDVIRHYEARHPRLKSMFPSIAMSINQEYANPDSQLKDGDEIGLLPPVSGGAETVAAPEVGHGRYAVIVREKINTQALLDRIKAPSDGAAIVFEGVVRNNTRGRRTLFLDYEAYEDMALKQMEELGRQALSRFSVRDVVLVHRLGRIEIGETSVAIVVASAHRAAAFEACRWLIDTLKRTVPIWKKEHFEDGAVWADGEPFPEGIAGTGSSRTEKPASN